MEDSKNDMVEKLSNLIKALEAGSYSSEDIDEVSKSVKKLIKNKPYASGVALQVTDQSVAAAKYLTDEAKKALSKKEKTLIAQFNDETPDGLVRRFAMCQYYVLRVPADRVEEGVKEMCSVINGLAEKGYIHSALTDVSSIKLAEIMFEKPTVAVFCFVHVRQEHAAMACDTKWWELEGGAGKAFLDLSVDLKPGEFLADGSFTHGIAMLASGASKEALIYERVQEYLKFLPQGTKFLGYRECAIMSLACPIELKFYHPYYLKVKRVELDHVRDVVLLEDEPEGQQLKQFNTFIGMRYYKENPISKEMEWFPPRQTR